MKQVYTVSTQKNLKKKQLQKYKYDCKHRATLNRACCPFSTSLWHLTSKYSYARYITKSYNCCIVLPKNYLKSIMTRKKCKKQNVTLEKLDSHKSFNWSLLNIGTTTKMNDSSL